MYFVKFREEDSCINNIYEDNVLWDEFFQQYIGGEYEGPCERWERLYFAKPVLHNFNLTFETRECYKHALWNSVEKHVLFKEIIKNVDPEYVRITDKGNYLFRMEALEQIIIPKDWMIPTPKFMEKWLPFEGSGINYSFGILKGIWNDVPEIYRKALIFKNKFGVFKDASSFWINSDTKIPKIFSVADCGSGIWGCFSDEWHEIWIVNKHGI